MHDQFGRRLRYLRISVTDRCNLRCRYCMPAEGVALLKHEDLLSYEEIITVVQEATRLGFDKVRITGGEPLIRRDIATLVAKIARLDGVTDLAMTTNGTLLGKYAGHLRAAGLQRLNISLDTLDAERYRELTRGGELHDVLAGIHAAIAAGFDPIKINCVVEQDSAEKDARAVAAFAGEYGLGVRFIRSMDLALGRFWKVEGGTGGDCTLCDRLRLSSDGLIRPCLFSNIGYSVRDLGAASALLAAIRHKPESGERCLNSSFFRVGG
jgi:cyclic pyranopterin phosphate synthase